MGIIREEKKLFSSHALILIPLLLFNLIFIALLLFRTPYATGFDGYYYGLQVRSVMETRRGVSNDPSLGYYLLALINLVVPDTILAIKISMLIISSSTVTGLYILGYKLAFRKLPAFLGTVIYILCFSHAMFSFEYLKNGIANLFLILFFILRLTRQGRVKTVFSLVFLFLTLWTHKLPGMVALIFLAAELIHWLWEKRRLLWNSMGFIKRTVIIAGLTLILTVALVVSLVRITDITHIVGNIHPLQGLNRYRLISGSFFSFSIKLELLLYHLIPLGFLWIYFRSKNHIHKVRAALFFFVSVILTLPVLRFSFDSIAYRLLLESGILMVPLFVLAADTVSGKAYPALLSAVGMLALLLIWQSPARLEHYAQHQSLDYGKLEGVAGKIPISEARNKKIIAHRGLSFFIWYKTGIRAFHFRPQSNLESFLRVAYGIGPYHFEPFRSGTNYKQARLLGSGYYLVEEGLWNRFYEQRKGDLLLLNSWMNPSRIRPDFMYRFRNGE